MYESFFFFQQVKKPDGLVIVFTVNGITEFNSQRRIPQGKYGKRVVSVHWVCEIKKIS